MAAFSNEQSNNNVNSDEENIEAGCRETKFGEKDKQGILHVCSTKDGHGIVGIPISSTRKRGTRPCKRSLLSMVPPLII